MTEKDWLALEVGAIVFSTWLRGPCEWLVTDICDDLTKLRTHNWNANTKRLVQLQPLKPPSDTAGFHTWSNNPEPWNIRQLAPRELEEYTGPFINFCVGYATVEENAHIFFPDIIQSALDDKVMWLPNSADMYDVLVAAHIFSSRSQARKNWKGAVDIPLGWSDFFAGKKKLHIAILKQDLPSDAYRVVDLDVPDTSVPEDQIITLDERFGGKWRRGDFEIYSALMDV
jgi:hypothetical protein